MTDRLGGLSIVLPPETGHEVVERTWTVAVDAAADIARLESYTLHG